MRIVITGAPGLQPIVLEGIDALVFSCSTRGNADATTMALGDSWQFLPLSGAILGGVLDEIPMDRRVPAIARVLSEAVGQRIRRATQDLARSVTPP